MICGPATKDPLDQDEVDSAYRELERLRQPAVRTTFAPKTDADVARVFASAFGAMCLCCRRSPAPGLTYKNLSICAACAPVAREMEIMIDMNDVTEAEEKAGSAAIDRAGEYLASIDKFDLRDLSEAELRTFNAHYIAGFADSMRAQAEVQPPF